MENAISQDNMLDSQDKPAGSTDSESGNSAPNPVKKPSFRQVPISERAQISCQEDLIQVLERHSKWMATVLSPQGGMPEGRANLSGLDLSPYDFTGVNLRGANLAGASLEGCILDFANLSGCQLNGTSFRGASLKGARLLKANISDADFRGADLSDAVVQGLDFSQSIMSSDEVEEELPKDLSREVPSLGPDSSL
jgi:hypothetical protein